MINSPHLAGMTPEARRCALLMALEAARMDAEEMLQDAILRQRALNDHEDSLQERLRAFESAKGDENRAIQTELDRITSQHLSRIQANLDAVARAQDEFQGWQKRKQQECQRISEAASFCVPQGGASGMHGLAAVLEHASKPRR
jgi:small-conductance mechanosensitive channel